MLQQRTYTFGGVIGKDVLLDLGAEVVDIVSLHYTLNRAGDVLEEDLVEFH